jgi:hypothetical protein
VRHHIFDTIFTLEGRGNIYLDILSDHFGLSSPHIYSEIHRSFRHLTTILEKKGIGYKNLKAALVPNIHRNERAFAFDWWKTDEINYGNPIIRSLLPTLHHNSTHSILCGDWIPNAHFDEILSMSPSIISRTHAYSSGKIGDTLYFVYINNLSTATAERLHAHLAALPHYVGSLNLDFFSPTKALLSNMLVRALIKHKNIILQGHEDDRDDDENVNLSPFNFESLGLAIRSVPLLLYGLFLSYKIERLKIQGERDSDFSLNALTPNPSTLSRLTVVLERDKLDYLREKKLGSLKISGLSELSAPEIANQIRSKIEHNYIYNLSRSSSGDSLKFNIVLEFFGKTRRVCALEYRPEDHVLRVITFY